MTNILRLHGKYEEFRNYKNGKTDLKCVDESLTNEFSPKLVLQK